MWPFPFLLLLFVCVCTAHSNPKEESSQVTSGSNDEIYNVCPVIVDFAEEQETLSHAELKADAADAAMSAYLLSHPNNTLWDYFNIELEQIHDNFLNLPLIGRLQRTIKNVFNFSLDTAIAFAQMIADIIEWFLNTLRHPLVGAHQVIDFFSNFGKNLKELWGLMKVDPANTAENMAGGFLLHIEHHMAEFTAESILMIGAGTMVIHGLIHSAEAVAGQLSAAASNTLLSVLVFIHAIDDPILIVTPLITSILDMSDDLVNGSTNHNVTTVTTDAVKPLDTCMIPEEFRPKFSTRDLCLSSSVYVRLLLFGSTKRSVKMTKPERVAAYNRFHDFVCCFLEDHEFEVNTLRTDNAKFEKDLISVPVKMQNCSQLMGNYSADTTWHPTASYETTTKHD